MADTRRLGIVIKSTKGALPVLVAASISPVTACGDGETIDSTASTHGTGAAAGAAGSGGASGAGGSTTGGFGGIVTAGSTGFGGIGGGFSGSSGVGGSSDAGIQCFGSFEEYVVQVPPEGVPADPGQICAVAVDPVDSNNAARVTLSVTGADSADGFMAIDPAIAPRIVGLPVVEVIDASPPELTGMQVQAVQSVAGGFSFRARWPAPIYSYTYMRITVRVTLELDCAPELQTTRIVHAATDIHGCESATGPVWVSSGDRCIVCRVVAEMAPSPIVPDKGADGLPLARALRLRIVELARVGSTVVLLAENDGGAGLDYEWHPSDGRIEQLAPDVVAWTVAEGMAAPFIQAAVWGADAAAVTSWAWNEAA